MTPVAGAAVGRADLARLRAQGWSAALVAEWAETQGLVRVASSRRDSNSGATPAVGGNEAQTTTNMPFWRAVSLKVLDDSPQQASPQATTPALSQADIEQPERSLHHTPPTPDLARWAELWPRLRRALNAHAARRLPDVPKLVRRLSRGHPLRRIPRKRRPTWPNTLHLWIDHSERLTPIWRAQLQVAARLIHLAARGAVTVHVVRGAPALPSRQVRAGDRVLALSDLGLYASAGVRARWARLGQALRAQGVQTVALVTAPQPAQRLGWRAVAWDREAQATDQGVEQLLDLLAPLDVVQIGLLRTLRRTLPGLGADAELQVWNHPDVKGRDPLCGVVFRPEAMHRRLQRFTALSKRVRVGAAAAVKTWHEGLPDSLLAVETLAWASVDRDGAPMDEDWASKYVQGLERAMADRGVAGLRRLAVTLVDRLPADSERDPALQAAIDRLWRAAVAEEETAVIPASVVEPVDREDGEGIREGYRRLTQVGGRLTWAWGGPEWGSPGSPGSPLAVVEARGDAVTLRDGSWRARATEPGVEFGQHKVLVAGTRRVEVTLETWSRPEWACAAGRDRYGLWATLKVGDVKHRLRWIPPGRFTMGSPEGEAGRSDREGPQRKVTLTGGFWLGETPVTQALWVAVMGKNPSRFQDPERPVERVSWDDTHRFFDLLRDKHGFGAHLPTEAQWEYACRAGTRTATWLGDLEILGGSNAPLLDDIAWYGGNSGHRFDLENGERSGWLEQQYPHTVAGTRKVGQKQANPFGLYDMLGNVWEWCNDYWQLNYQGEDSLDPSGPAVGEMRVHRGGAWGLPARSARSASRYWGRPAEPRHLLGFRLASSLAEGDEEAGRIPSHRAKRRSDANGEQPNPGTPPRSAEEDLLRRTPRWWRRRK